MDFSLLKNNCTEELRGLKATYGNLICLFFNSFLASKFSQNDSIDKTDLEWIKTNIVDRYRFVKDPQKDMWINQPNFKGELGTPEFIATADRVKTFFDRNNDWESTKKNPEFRTKDSCLNLLYITAARYLLVTHVLYIQSDEKLVPCSRTTDKKIVIPDSGVCYPEPYGTASCTSDYDVGLIGKNAGYLTESFNVYFQDAKGFGKPSELVFDTNVYAFTLEFAMPFLFSQLPTQLTTGVAKNEQTLDFQMQELASAYYKVFKYNANFFQTLVTSAKNAMKAPESKGLFEVWLKTLNDMNAQVSIRPEGKMTSLNAFRTAHNNEYQNFVKSMSASGGYNPQFLGNYRQMVLRKIY